MTRDEYISHEATRRIHKAQEQWRIEALKRANYHCEKCGSPHLPAVHHKQSQALHPELIDKPANLIVLCPTCHNNDEGDNKVLRASQAEIARHKRHVTSADWAIVEDMAQKECIKHSYNEVERSICLSKCFFRFCARQGKSQRSTLDTLKGYTNEQLVQWMMKRLSQVSERFNSDILLNCCARLQAKLDITQRQRDSLINQATIFFSNLTKGAE